MKRKQIKPRRIFEELAEMGILTGLLETKWRQFYDKNEKFRDDINEILLNYSNAEVSVLEKYYLEQLCASLQYFIDYTKLWTNQKQ